MMFSFSSHSGGNAVELHVLGASAVTGFAVQFGTIGRGEFCQSPGRQYRIQYVMPGWNGTDTGCRTAPVARTRDRCS